MTKYKMILFDMDDTLLKGRTIHIIGRDKGFLEEVIKLENSDIISYKKNEEIAKLLKGLTIQECLGIFRTIPLQDHLTEVLKEIKNKGLKTGIITNSYQFLADDLKDRLELDYAIGNILVHNNNIITGDLVIRNKQPTVKKHHGCRQHPICKKTILQELSKKTKIPVAEMVTVGDGRIDICMLREAGLGIAYRASEEVQRAADISINDLKDILKYI
ncbi:MAG: HAD-IB family phosphatase [Candidatus Thermoplasmatota archaeon]